MTVWMDHRGDASLGTAERLAPGVQPASAGPGPRLTDRELEVAELIADGLTDQAIARRLSVAPRTAEAHVENIRRKLQVHSRAQIAAWVTEHRLRR